MNSFWRYLLSLYGHMTNYVGHKIFTFKKKDYVSRIPDPPTLIWPVKPNRGVRQIDAAGDGRFGASRDGGTRLHLGLDLIAHPGDDIIAPCECEVTHIGLAYAGSYLGAIHLRGWSSWSAYTFKLLYVEPEVTVGEILVAGEIVGSSQSVADYYAAKGINGMTNHIHFEVHNAAGEPIDPLTLMERV